MEWAISIAAWVLVGAAGLLTLWALFWDRARGGLRCPKCWYDMVGAPGLVCPECGRDARREQRLRKTRRRWRLARIAALMLIPAWCLGQMPAYQRGGMWAAVPRPVVIWMMPRIITNPAPGPRPALGSLEFHLTERIFADRWELAPLWWPERWLLTERSVQVLESDRSSAGAKALAARALVIVRREAVERVSMERAGPVVLAKCMKTYAQAETYWDRGETTEHHGTSRFARAFARDENGQHRFRDELLSRQQFDGGEENWVTWSVGDVEHSWSSRTGSRKRSHIEAILGFPNHSLLVPEALFSPFSMTGNSNPIEMACQNGRLCYVVAPSRWQEVWIDAETFLILKRIIGPGLGETFDPHVDVPIHDSWFTHGPPGSAWWLLDGADPSKPVPRR